MRNNGAYFKKAYFDSVCPETGKQIKKGDEVAYYPLERKAFHFDSKAALELRKWQAVRAFTVLSPRIEDWTAGLALLEILIDEESIGWKKGALCVLHDAILRGALARTPVDVAESIVS